MAIVPGAAHRALPHVAHALIHAYTITPASCNPFRSRARFRGSNLGFIQSVPHRHQPLCSAAAHSQHRRCMYNVKGARFRGSDHDAFC
eukprot:5251976-Pyramimonas_sp.AAC.1